MEKNQILFDKVKNLDIPLGEYALFGSAAMGIRRLRECNDINIIVKKGLFDNLKKDSKWRCGVKENTGSEFLEKDGVEIVCEWEFPDFNVNDLIDESEIIMGLPFVKLQYIVEWKKKKKRKIDLEDIEVITNYLKDNI